MILKVLSASKTSEYTGKYGLNYEYTLNLQDLDGRTYNAKLSQKPETPVPSGEMDLSLEETKYGLRAKKNFNQGARTTAPNASFAMTTPKQTSMFGGRSQDDQERIMRQNAMNRALDRRIAVFNAKVAYCKDADEVDVLVEKELEFNRLVGAAEHFLNYFNNGRAVFNAKEAPVTLQDIAEPIKEDETEHDVFIENKERMKRGEPLKQIIPKPATDQELEDEADKLFGSGDEVDDGEKEDYSEPPF